MNTKKLNAGIAFLCLQNMDDQGAIPEDRVLQITKLADQSESTELYIEGTNNLEIIDQCIALIQEYIRSVSTDINIARVEVLRITQMTRMRFTIKEKLVSLFECWKNLVSCSLNMVNGTAQKFLLVLF